MSGIIIQDADFFEYKEQLKSFLKGQARFKDYDFEGSNMSILLDVLAYNTYQNAFYNNMSINEMFLDSAQLENSVLSHAKALNYTPRSVISAAAKISFNLKVTDNSPFVTIPEHTAFTSSAKGKQFTFYTHEAITVFPTDGVYSSGCVDIYEGEIVEEKYFAKSDVTKAYRISNFDVDMTSIRVFVTDLDGNRVEYIRKDDLYGADSNDSLFYVQCTDGFYEVYFGQTYFGIQPAKNSIIEIQYRVSSGSAANGVSAFSTPSTIGGYAAGFIKTVNSAFGGAARESLESIKFFAPRTYQVKDRAITENDYEIILKNKFPEIQTVSAMGGEKLSPPQYGKVAIYVDTVGADGISENIKEKITQHIKKRTPLAIEPIVLAADFVHLKLSTVVTYNVNKTPLTAASIREQVKSAIKRYSDSKLNKFGSTLYYSDLVSYIDDSDASIVSNQTSVSVFVEKYPVLSKNNRYTVNFENEMLPIADYAFRSLQSQVPNHPVIPKLESERQDRLPTLYTSNFVYNGKNVYIRDNGFGSLQIIQNTATRDIIIEKNVGSVDYKTGLVKIEKFTPQSIANGVFRIYANPKMKDIKTPKSSILSIRTQDVEVKVEV